MRFRFRMVGERLMQEYGKEIADKFADEIELRSPPDQCSQQCAATVENSAPTYYRHAEARPGASPYARLILPMGMLLGAVTFKPDHEVTRD